MSEVGLVEYRSQGPTGLAIKGKSLGSSCSSTTVCDAALPPAPLGPGGRPDVRAAPIGSRPAVFVRTQLERGGPARAVRPFSRATSRGLQQVEPPIVDPPRPRISPRSKQDFAPILRP